MKQIILSLLIVSMGTLATAAKPYLQPKSGAYIEYYGIENEKDEKIKLVVKLAGGNNQTFHFYENTNPKLFDRFMQLLDKASSQINLQQLSHQTAKTGGSDADKKYASAVKGYLQFYEVLINGEGDPKKGGEIKSIALQKKIENFMNWSIKGSKWPGISINPNIK